MKAYQITYKASKWTQLKHTCTRFYPDLETACINSDQVLAETFPGVVILSVELVADPRNDPMTYKVHWVNKSGAHATFFTSDLDTVREKLEALFKQRIEAVARDKTGREVGMVGELIHGPFTWYCTEEISQ